MTDFTVHTLETAPEGAREALDGLKGKYGFIPNIAGVMSEAPGLLKGYLTMVEQLEGGTLSPTEQQLILLATSYENRCTYCVSAHSAIASMQHVPEDVIASLRSGAPISDPKLEALRRLTVAIVEKRGFVEDADVQAFLAAGYTRAQLLEVILGVGIKTLSNYMNHIAHTPLDDAFAPVAWAPPA